MSYILNGDATALPVADGGVDCIVTSPRYNARVAYQGVSDDTSWREYGRLVRGSSREMARVLKDGGRAWVNVPAASPGEGGNEDRKDVGAMWHAGLKAAGLRYRDWIVWEQIGADCATAWGSHLSPNCPNIRGRYELVLAFSKGPWTRGRVEVNDCPPEMWADLTRNVWRIPCAPRNGHPAPFPAELVGRCLWLSTWPGDVVLDPFAGSFTTPQVAHEMGRVGIGVELSGAYCKAAGLYGFQGSLMPSVSSRSGRQRRHRRPMETEHVEVVLADLEAQAGLFDAAGSGE